MRMLPRNLKKPLQLTQTSPTCIFPSDGITGQLEEYDKAIEEFGNANSLNPIDPLPVTYISRTYATVGEYAKAIQYAEQPSKMRQTDPYMYGNLGTCIIAIRQYEVHGTAAAGCARRDEPGWAKGGGLPFDYGRIVEYYYFYGLSLARQGQCGEALPISQSLIQGATDDEISVVNANEMINICKEVAQGTVAPGSRPYTEANRVRQPRHHQHQTPP